MTLRESNNVVEVDTAVPENRPQHNVYDDKESMRPVTEEKTSNNKTEPSYDLFLRDESGDDCFDDELLDGDNHQDGSCFFRFWREHCSLCLPMAGWFAFSSILSCYNKYVFGKKHMAFPCPLLLTSIHFTVQWVFSWSLTNLYPKTLGGDQIQSMTHRKFWGVSIPCGLVTSSDIGLSNLAMVRISITFYTMVKASSPIFVIACAYLFGIERITWTLILVVFVISCGEFLTVLGEINFDLLGFLLVLMASIFSGMRWTLVQLKLKGINPPLKSPLATMRVLSPVMFFSMIFLSIVLEKPWEKLPIYFSEAEVVDDEGNVSSHGTPMKVIWLGLLGALLAICMVLCEFYLIMYSNAIVLMIGGVLKEILTIFMGVFVFHDYINPINMLGCVIVFLGVILYKMMMHISKMEAKASIQTDGTQINALVKKRSTAEESVEDNVEDVKDPFDASNTSSTVFVIDDEDFDIPR